MVGELGVGQDLVEQLLGGLGLAPPGVEVDQLGEGFGIAGLAGEDATAVLDGQVVSPQSTDIDLAQAAGDGDRVRVELRGLLEQRDRVGPEPPVLQAPGRGIQADGLEPAAILDGRRPERHGCAGGSSPGWLKKAATSGLQPDVRAAGPVEDLAFSAALAGSVLAWSVLACGRGSSPDPDDGQSNPKPAIHPRDVRANRDQRVERAHSVPPSHINPSNPSPRRATITNWIVPRVVGGVGTGC